MDSLKDIISDIRVFLYGGISTLPLTIAGTMSILGLFTANYAILFFLLGFLIIAPLGATIINVVFGSLFSGLDIFKAKTGEICKVVIPYTTLKSPIGISDGTVISSSWMAMLSFFIGYLFTNGLELYNRETNDTEIIITSTSESDLNKMVTTRKSQAIVAMASIIILALIVVGFRYSSGCESILGMILTGIIFIFTGYGWYKALSKIGQDRLSDLFGIANRLLPPSAINNVPIACIPVPNS
jgi:hypothetical protein